MWTLRISQATTKVRCCYKPFTFPLSYYEWSLLYRGVFSSHSQVSCLSLCHSVCLFRTPLALLYFHVSLSLPLGFGVSFSFTTKSQISFNVNTVLTNTQQLSDYIERTCNHLAYISYYISI